MGPLSAAEICAVFNSCFAAPDMQRTRMHRGGDEPLYIPAHAGQPQAQIIYARGLAQSCLHEAAHWLYASHDRRQLVDYGYWYVPDGRNDEEQALFEQHEIEVQAREYLLSLAASTQFRVSADNLRSPEPSANFCRAIALRVKSLCTGQRSQRLNKLFQALCMATKQSAETLLINGCMTLDEHLPAQEGAVTFA